MAMTTHVKSKVLNLLFRGVTMLPYTTLYIAVSTSKPSEDGIGVTEPTDASYARLAVTCNTTNFSVSVNGQAQNAVTLRFTEAANPWNTSSNLIKYYAVYDATTGGNMLWFGQLTSDKNVVAESVLEIPIGGFITEFINEE